MRDERNPWLCRHPNCRNEPESHNDVCDECRMRAYHEEKTRDAEGPFYRTQVKLMRKVPTGPRW